MLDFHEPRASGAPPCPAPSLEHVCVGRPESEPCCQGPPDPAAPLLSLLELWALRQTEASSFFPLFLESEQTQVQMLSAIALLGDLGQSIQLLRALVYSPAKWEDIGFVVRSHGDSGHKGPDTK